MILLDPDLDLNPPPHSPAPSAASHVPSVRTLTRFLGEAQSAVRLRGQVAVLLTTDRRIRRLNRDFRGIDKPTDVLSFPSAPCPENLAGDLAISIPAARRQAAAQGHSLAIEIKVLMLHGLLHLAGYEHEADTGQMARRERLLRARLKLPLGLIERTAAPSSRPTTKAGCPILSAASRGKGGKPQKPTRQNTRSAKP